MILEIFIESTTEFKITEVPTNGDLTLSVTNGKTIIDKQGDQTTVTQDLISKVEISKDQIVTLGQIGAGKVEFVPNNDTDEDGSFKFQVGNGMRNFRETEYETTIDVKAVSDAAAANVDDKPHYAISIVGLEGIDFSDLKTI